MNAPDAAKPSGALPWYKDGLRFKCTECGKCCTGPTGYVWVTEEEMALMARALNITLSVFQRKYIRRKDNRYALIEKRAQNGDYDCIFLNDKKCGIYQMRPKQCQAFPWWRDNLRTEENWKQAAEECEGINDQAPMWAYSTIVETLQSITENE